MITKSGVQKAANLGQKYLSSDNPYSADQP